ncbi:MAG: thioredoxin-like domain-containing protein [Candidatus Omnitrophota bacterium]|jgi:thiol-disulfide isomerase/thioredoxin/DNA-binding beta-propeller fold protein YncE
MKQTSRFFYLCLAALWLLNPGGRPACAGVVEYLQHKQAPALRAGLDWLNTEAPLTLTDLKGKFVLLNFWTYSSVNCINLFPELKALQKKYSRELVVVGIHSPKYPIQRHTNNVKEAVIRYRLDYPVVNDAHLRIWRDYDIHAWPTIILIDPEGKIIHKQLGEDVYAAVDKVLTTHINHSRFFIRTKPVALRLERNKAHLTSLSFPGKVLATENERLFIADSGHNRILMTDWQGHIQDVIGSGIRGIRDGVFETACFADPQGMAAQGDILYVADAGNHAVRKVNLKTREVVTIAGTGRKNTSRFPKGAGTSVDLNFPTDLTLINDQLYIAMTGAHQIWVLNLKDGNIQVYAGSGVENLINGPLIKSAFAQPAGIVSVENALYVLDSEVSAVRHVGLLLGAKVDTMMGQGLHTFGDDDGAPEKARLQHPLGICKTPESLFIADTYNNKIRMFSLADSTLNTLSGDIRSGFKDGLFQQALFNEPGGLSYMKNQIFIADTNNHSIRVLDLENKRVGTMPLKGNVETFLAGQPLEKDFKGSTQKLRKTFSNDVQDLTLSIKLPRTSQIFYEGKPYLRLFTAGGDFHRLYAIYDQNSTFHVYSIFASDTLYAEVFVTYCQTGQPGNCMKENRLYVIPLTDKKPSGDIRLFFKG